MTNTVKIDKKNIATIDITIDSKTAKEAYDRALKAFSAQVNIAGFRKGKAPKNVVEKYVGADRIKAEVVDRLFPNEFQKAVEENKLNIAVRPSLEHVDFNVGEDLKLKATVELKPEVTLGEYKGREIKFEEFKNPKDALEKELEQTQRRFSRLEKVDRASTDKDSVVFDFEGFVGEEKIEHGSGSNYTLDLANSNFIPGFAEGLVGHSAGEEFDIKVKFPKDYHEDKLKGANATFKIKLHEVKERKLPEIDDELAKRAGRKSLEEFKGDLKKLLDGNEKNQNDRIKSDAIFDKLVEEVKIEIQPTMLDREYQAVMEEARVQTTQGGDCDKLVEAEGKEKTEERFREEARKRIINSLIVEKIAQAENIVIENKDVTEHITRLAMAYGIAPNQLFEEIRKNPNSYSALAQQILATKVNNFLLENNKFSPSKAKA